MNNSDLLEHVTAAFVLEGERIRDHLMVGMGAFDRGNRITAARYRPMPLYSNQPTWDGAGRYVGFSLFANGGACRVLLHDGHDTSGDVFAVIDLAAQEHDSQWFGPGGISFTEALYVEVVGAGTLQGAVYLGAVD